MIGHSFTDGNTWPYLVRQAIADARSPEPILINAAGGGDVAGVNLRRLDWAVGGAVCFDRYAKRAVVVWRDGGGLDLKALGQRWYGDPSRFVTWQDVTIPDIQGFFGALEEGGLRLDRNWQWRKAGGSDDEPPPAGEAGWTPLAVQPSQQQSFLPWGAAFYRTDFDPAAWKEQSVYLHIETATQWLGSVVVNDRPINYTGFLHPFGLRAETNFTPYVQPGRSNRIELWPFATIPRNEKPKGNPADMEVQSIRMGCTADP